MTAINRRSFIHTLSYGLGTLMFGSARHTLAATRKHKPNFVILFADDMGYGDWSRGGHPTIHTPNLNLMADEGVQMTQFYSACPVCSPSRAALLTGRNPCRTGILHVFFPENEHGMNPHEITLAEALQPLGYRSACIGKWHLGHTEQLMPRKQGFDYYYGILYSNDMRNPDLYRNEKRIECPTDQTTLTRRYTDEAIQFIEQSREVPFLLYLPYTMPHIPLFASERFLDTSKRGLYGDTIEEIDWSVGQIIAALDRHGLSESTFVLFTSDNGPWMTQNQHGGSAGLLRGAKGDTWEGGMREPCIARWPGVIPAGTVSSAVGSTLDIFPTCVTAADGMLPEDRPLDGIDLLPILQGKQSPERTIYYYIYDSKGDHLRAMRKGKWKIHFSYCENNYGDFSTTQRTNQWIKPETPLLFDLETDPSERFDLAGKYPVIVSELTQAAKTYERDVQARGENKDLIEWFVNDWPKHGK